jgi:hypothetical protein
MFARTPAPQTLAISAAFCSTAGQQQALLVQLFNEQI